MGKPQQAPLLTRPSSILSSTSAPLSRLWAARPTPDVRQLGGPGQEAKLTNVVNLPNQVDAARPHILRIVPVNQPLQVGQLCGDTKAVSHHEDVFVSLDRDALAVWSPEQDQGAGGMRPFGAVQEIASKASPGLDEEVEGRLRLFGPRDHHKWVGL